MELVVCDVTFEGRDEKCICFLNGVILLLGYAKYNAHMLNQVFMTLEGGDMYFFNISWRLIPSCLNLNLTHKGLAFCSRSVSV